jgi:hypothetical protein
MQLMNYSQVFDKYFDQNWDADSQLNLLLSFLDQHSHQIVTPHLFDDFLSQIVDEQDHSLSQIVVHQEQSFDPFGNDFLLRTLHDWPETD